MNTNPELKLPKIALIGMEGSGKTVLTTVLAKRMSRPEQHFYLDPHGKTLKYVEEMWHTLQNGEWPPSTPPGQLFELTWNLCVYDKKYELRLVDAAGQDMRLLFGGDEKELNSPNLPDDLKKLVTYCREASILLITLNISDFVGEGDTRRLIENQAAIKSALDILSHGNQNVAFIFTQCDQYRAMIDEVGGLEEFCKQNLNYVYNAHITGKKNAIFGVAAVNEVERRHVDGMVRRVPARNFTSVGLDEVIEWIVGQVEKATAKAEKKHQKELDRIEQERIAEEQKTSQEKTIKEIVITIAIIVGFFILLFIFANAGSSGGGSGDSSGYGSNDNWRVSQLQEQIAAVERELELCPQPLITSHKGNAACTTGIFSCYTPHKAIVTPTVQNNGRTGLVCTTAAILVNEKELVKKSLTYTLEANCSYPIPIELFHDSFCFANQKWQYSVRAEPVDDEITIANRQKLSALKQELQEVQGW